VQLNDIEADLRCRREDFQRRSGAKYADATRRVAQFGERSEDGPRPNSVHAPPAIREHDAEETSA
jgi:hypothetical protein